MRNNVKKTLIEEDMCVIGLSSRSSFVKFNELLNKKLSSKLHGNL